MDSVPHSQKVALVTGACGGLGRAIAEKFLQQGANVVVCDINEKLIADFKEKVSSAYPECTLVVKADITDDAALDDLFAQTEKTFGHVDFVINNCGIMDRFDPVGDMERNMWDRVIAINLTAPAMVTKRAVNSMLKHDIKGSIVNISSIAGLRGFASGAAYTASGMQTNIASKYITEQGLNFNMEGYGVHAQAFPNEHLIMVEIEKIAGFVSYLCSDAASVINGATLTADGGWTAN
ncbi:hypothetical protein LTR86_007854 [Recurvomyces mirabilis]|nr:hypothetical protein LTR86_007854 [Recurvomyces mirabilis]